MEEFKVGDVVRLKSGGPAMTVSKKVAEGLTCIWYAGDELGYSKSLFDPQCVSKLD